MSRPADPRPDVRHCLSCEHHLFDDENGLVSCNHPERPGKPVVVFRWFAGCPNHKPEAPIK